MHRKTIFKNEKKKKKSDKHYYTNGKNDGIYQCTYVAIVLCPHQLIMMSMHYMCVIICIYMCANVVCNVGCHVDVRGRNVHRFIAPLPP